MCQGTTSSSNIWRMPISFMVSSFAFICLIKYRWLCNYCIALLMKKRERYWEGKKTYKATFKNKKTKIKLKKKLKYGKKYTIRVYYKGKLLYKDFDYAYYAKKLKTGMTMKQARWTWCSSDRKSKSSNGWTYWFYDGGSYIAFKNGRVNYWYSSGY